MRFLAPLGFIFAASLPIIVAFYLLKLRRVRHEVPSTMLWRRAAEDLHANAPFQKLRRNLLLLLQLIIAAFLVFGLARPYMNLKNSRTKNTVMMIDHSASMNAKDAAGGKSRLEQAKTEALNYVRGMAPGDSAMVIAFASKANVVAQFSDDKTALESAVDGIKPTDLPTAPVDAFSLAQSLAKPVQAALRVYSDGTFGAAPIRLAPGTECQFIPLGKTTNNVGIVTLDLRRPPENSKEFQVFATVRNYSDQPRTSRLEVLNAGKLIDAKTLDLKPNAESSQLFSSSQVGLGRVQITVDGEDDLAADNSAYAVIKPPRKRTLLLVSAGNYFLERVLREDSGHQIEVQKIAPAQYTAASKADVIIFDNFAPPAPLQSGNYFFVNAKPPVDGFSETGGEDNPIIFDWDEQHAMMRYAELSDVQIRRARKFAMPAASQVLAESRDTPLISIYSAENRNIVLWSFDIFESNLPLRVAFPLLVSNTLDWLLRGSHGTESSSIAAGQAIQSEVTGEFRRAAMIDPAKRAWALVPNAANRLVFDRTDRAGFYTLEVNGKPADEFGVSMINVAESDIAPRQSLNLAGGGQVMGTTAERRTNREIWKWFAVGALAFILTEWLIYHRRVLV